MKKGIKFLLLSLIVVVLGTLLSVLMEESVLVCDIYIMVCMLTYGQFVNR